MLNAKHRPLFPRPLPPFNSRSRSCLHVLILLLSSVLLGACGSSGGNDGPPPVTNPAEEGGPIEVHSDTFQDSTETIVKTLLDMHDFTGHLISTQVFGLLEYEQKWKTEQGTSKLPTGCVKFDREQQSDSNSTGIVNMTFTNCAIHVDLPPRNLTENAARHQDYNMYADITLSGQVDVDIHRDGGYQRLAVTLTNLYWNAWDGKIPTLNYNCQHRIGSLVLDAITAGDIANADGEQLQALLDTADEQIEADNADGGTRVQALLDSWKDSTSALELVAHKILNNHLRKLHREHYKANGTVVINSFGGEVETLSNLLFLNQHNGITSEAKDLVISWIAKGSPGMPFGRSILRDTNPTEPHSGKLTMKAINHYTVSGSGAFNTAVFKITGAGPNNVVLSYFATSDKTDLVASMAAGTVEVVDREEVGHLYNSAMPNWKLGDDHRQNHCRPQFAIGAASSPKIFDTEKRLYTPLSFWLDNTFDPDYNFHSLKWRLSKIPQEVDVENDVINEKGWAFSRFGMRFYHYGDYEIEATVADKTSGTTLQKPFYITMREPVFSVAAPDSLNGGEQLSLSVAVEDGYEGTLSYALLAAPDGASIDEKGNISWTAASPYFGDNVTVNLVVGVSNADNTVSQKMSFTVNDNTKSPTVIPSLTNASGRSSTAMLDVHGDDRKEWIVSNNSTMLFGYQLNSSRLQHVWTYPYDLTNAGESIKGVQTVNVGGVPRLAVLTTHYLHIIDPTKAKPLQSVKLVGHVESDSWNRFTVTDLDNDDEEELIVQTNTSTSGTDTPATQRITIYGNDLSWNWPFIDGDFQRFVVGNVDSDDQKEIITQNGFIFDGASYQEENHHDSSFSGNLVVFNHDNDGIQEIGVISGSNMTVYTPDSTNASFIELDTITLNATVGQSDLYYFVDIDQDQVDEFIWASSISSEAAIASLSLDALSFETLSLQGNTLGSQTTHVALLNESGSQYLSTLVRAGNGQIVLSNTDISLSNNWNNTNEIRLSGSCWAVDDDFTDRSFTSCDMYSPGIGNYVGVMEVSAGGNYRFGPKPTLAGDIPDVGTSMVTDGYPSTKDAFFAAHNVGSDSAQIFANGLLRNSNSPSNLPRYYQVYDFDSGVESFNNFILEAIGGDFNMGRPTPLAFANMDSDDEMELIGSNDAFYTHLVSPPSFVGATLKAEEIRLDLFDNGGDFLDSAIVQEKTGYFNGIEIPPLLPAVSVRDVVVTNLFPDTGMDIAYLQEQRNNHNLQFWHYSGGALRKKAEKPLGYAPGMLLIEDLDGDGIKEIVISSISDNTIQILNRDLTLKKTVVSDGLVSAISLEHLSSGRTHLLLGLIRATTADTKYLVQAIDATSGAVAWESPALSGGPVKQVKIVTGTLSQEKYLHVITHNAVYVTQ